MIEVSERVKRRIVTVLIRATILPSLPLTSTLIQLLPLQSY